MRHAIHATLVGVASALLQLCGVQGAALAQTPTVETAALEPTPEAPTPQVELFSPRGSVKQVRQATARFNVPMVALGDPRLEDPFVVACDASGAGRWADSRNWVYDFDADLRAGLRCTFTLKAGLKALDGRAVGGTRTFTFDTGGPSIERSMPYEGWSGIDEEQVFLLKLDAPATPESIARHAYCIIDGLAERVPVTVLRGQERQEVLAQSRKLGYAYFSLLWKDGFSSVARVRDQALEEAEDLVVALKCQRRLPNATRVQLVWGAGITGPGGIATRRAQSLPFQVRAAFTATLECTRTEPRAGCTPTRPIRVRFSAPVAREQAMAARLRLGTEARSPDAQEHAQSKQVESITFKPPFPENVNASLELPAQLKDEAGRALQNAARFPLAVRIDEYPPLVKFSGEFGVLEAQEGGVLPVTLRNVDEPAAGESTVIRGHRLRVGNDPAAIARWLLRVREANARRGQQVRDANGQYQWREDTGSRSVFEPGDGAIALSITKPEGARPTEVVGIPLGQPGLHIVELESERLGAALLGRNVTHYVSTAALVTNLAVHLKWGRESSSVWVTRLDNSRPVTNAQVVVTGFCDHKELWRGTTGRDGVAHIDVSFGEPGDNEACGWGRPGVLVTASAPTGRNGTDAEEDFGFVVSSWNRGIAPYDFGLPLGSEWETTMVHTVLDRPLFRAGETVSMKHFVRRHESQGIVVPASAARTRRVVIAHESGEPSFTSEIPFGADGIAEQSWKIPAEARLGRYIIQIAQPREKERDDVYRSGEFRVEEFRLPTMRATVQGPARPLVQPRDATLDLHVSYVSGGGASGLPVKLRTVVEPWSLPQEGYEDFRFGGEPVREGVQIDEDSWDLDAEGASPAQAAKARVMPITLDAQGAARVNVADLPPVEKPSLLLAELEYPDPNGELLTATGRVVLVPSELNVGIRPESWVASAEQMRFRVVVLGLDGKPVAGRDVSVALYKSTHYSYRKRLIGGFYTYESATENTKLPVTCAGRTNAQGLLLCEVTPGVSGEVILRAEARDDDGRIAGATTSIWVAGEEDWWFGGTAADRMDLLPERPEYEPGQVARFQVRMPFRSATALVTVEREGVLRSFVTQLSGRAPVVKVPIEATDSPNVYVSVLAVRGRADMRRAWKKTPDGAREVTALVDLGKPAYRLGTAAIRVGWQPHRLDVRVTPERDTYFIRERANVTVEVKRADGSKLPPGAEIALAAVDEALLELAPNASWNLLEAMMGRRGLEVWTSTAQLQVVGKRHYGRKAVPHGGGGGRERAREAFDTLLTWQGRVKLDESGRAKVTVPLNDSLTSFRIVAVASAGGGLFGTGSASIATNQDLVLLSGVPPLVREGDRYRATFTLRNASKAPMVVNVSANVTPSGATSLPARQLEIPAGTARDVTWDMVAPVGSEQLSWEVRAEQLGGGARDVIKVSQTVSAAVPVRTFQATLAQLDKPLDLPLARPAGAIPGRGGIELSVRARLGDGLDGVREYMALYQYTCLEQNLSKAVALRDRALWDRWMERAPAYLDRDGLLKYFPSEQLQGEDALTAYVLAIAHEANWPVPEPFQTQLVTGLMNFVAGRVVRHSALPTADLTVRKLAAIAALARYGAAQPDMLDSITVEPDLWPTSAVIDWLGILRRVDGIRNAERLREQAENILRVRLNLQGTTMTFSTERRDALWWLMISPDSNAVRMLMEVLDRPAWREDIPRLVRGALGRQQRGHWNTTVANAWGVLAMEKFSAMFESVPVTGATSVSYGSQKQTVSFPRTAAEELGFPWQDGQKDLSLSHSGKGAPWAIVRATAALPLEAPLSSGFSIKRTVTPVEQQRAGQWTRGDVARVRLELEAQSDMSWVVVQDPVPGGATVLGSGLGGQSQMLTSGQQREGYAWPAFEERGFEGFRAYYRFVPKGRWVVEYTVRFNNPGTFVLPPTRVEAMYAPEMFGELPNGTFTVLAAE
jgi:uncharacterized protein YfaS (alpha-2-macroglobulin family)